MNSRLKVVHGQILSTQNVTSEVIGTRFGLSAYEMDALKGRLGDIQRELELKFKNDAELRVDQMAWMKLGFQDEAHLALIEQYAQDIRQNFEDFLVVGIGGSSLGAKALLHALNYRGAKNQTPNIVFLENADPETLARFENNLIERRGKLDFSKVLVNVISKSGTTAETAANFELLIEHMKKSNLSDADIAKRVIATTDAEKGTLRKTALDKGYRTLVVPDGVGGRFSVFSDVGLLPLAVGGVDIRRLLGGVKKGFDRVFLEFQDPLNHAFQIASLLYLLDQKKGAHLHCLFVFGEAFEEIAAWFEQLWAESLGKNGGGPRPLGMIGARALHSIHQDNVGGKRDKAIFLVGVQNPRVEGEASRILSLMLECAIRDLTDCGRPNMTLILPRIDEENLGELLFTLEMATHVVGRLYQVNPYDQPAVEEAKVGARQALLTLQKVSSENRVLGPLQKPAIAFENIKAENIGVEHGLASNEIQSLMSRLKKNTSGIEGC